MLRNTIAGIPAPPSDLDEFEHVAVARHGDMWTVEATPRSSLWPKMQRDHLKAEPACLACGLKRTWQGIKRGWRRNEVHHLRPFHKRPDLELADGPPRAADRRPLDDPAALDEQPAANLATFCREHHFRIGHDGDWLGYNEHALADAAALLASTSAVPAKRRRRTIGGMP